MRRSKYITLPEPAATPATPKPAPKGKAVAMPQQPANPIAARFISAQEVERIYGLSARTLANYRSQKVGPKYYKCGHRVIYRIADLDAYMEEHAVVTFGRHRPF